MTRTRPRRRVLAATLAAAVVLIGTGVPLAAHAGWNASASTTMTGASTEFAVALTPYPTIAFGASESHARNSSLFLSAPPTNVFATSLTVSAQISGADVEAATAMGLEARVADRGAGEDCSVESATVLAWGASPRSLSPLTTPEPVEFCLILTRAETDDSEQRAGLSITVTVTSGLGENWRTATEVPISVEFTRSDPIEAAE